ncbi:MAG: hypothetical protein LBC87_10050 [Fibromonadaceae bacterium]|jgi:hypothetical protein|nr:hypothetical protein [Fibromonadaceae bacterium]
MRYAIIVLGLFCSMSFAQVSAALDSIEENVIGFAMNGQAKGGILSSTLSSETLPKGEDVSEYLAFNDFLLNISVRPNNETKATFDLRFHKDWQSAYREGNNAPIVRWWSYDGNIMDKSLKFNLGTMRIAYTPLTIYLPEPDMIMEPEIFSEMKREAMEDRYLDGTNRRLLQGINAEYSISAGMLDKIFLQGTIVRLRKVAEASDRISFDFDPNKDRFSMAARVGVETHGAYLGVNEVYTFNRFSSSLKNSKDGIDYEKNNVLSLELNYNSKKLLEGPVSFGIGAEYALSNWSHWRHDTTSGEPEIFLNYATISLPSLNGINSPPGAVGSNVYPYYTMTTSTKPQYKLSEIESIESQGALLGNAFVQYKENPFEVKLSGHFLKTDKDFESELAASPAYLPNLPILNSDAALEYNLQQFRTGSLENMYYSLYYTLPLSAITIVSGSQGTPSTIFGGRRPIYQNSRLDNNYKLAQYYRNSYTQQTYTRLERREQILDPAVNLALPYGYATPDRSGGDADLNFVWNRAVSVRAVFGTYSSEFQGKFTRLGGGTEINIARLADLSKALTLSASYEQNKQEEGFNDPQASRIMAGFKVGIWRGLSLIGGFQQLEKEYKNPYTYEVITTNGAETITTSYAMSKTSERLIIGGPQVKISERANLNLQGGLLSNAISFTIDGNGREIDLSKYIMSGTVTVEF